MYLNTFTSGLDPLDMTELEEFASLLKSASELGIHGDDVRRGAVRVEDLQDHLAGR